MSSSMMGEATLCLLIFVFVGLASAQQQCNYLGSYQSYAVLSWSFDYSEAVATIPSTCDGDEELMFEIASNGNFAEPIAFGPFYTMTEANYTLFTSNAGGYGVFAGGSGDANDYALAPGCVTVSSQTLVVVVTVTYGSAVVPYSGAIDLQYSVTCITPTQPPPSFHGAGMIGGLVGGVGGALLLFAILFVCCRSRNRKRVIVTQTTTTSPPPPSVVIPMPVVVPVAPLAAPPPVTNVAQSSSSSAPVINFSPVITVAAPTTQSVSVDARPSGGVPPTYNPEDLL